MLLSAVCEIQSGYSARARPAKAERGSLAVQLGDVREDGVCELADLERLDLGRLHARYFVTNGDVLFRSRGDRTTASAVQGLDEPAAVILPLVILRPLRNRVEPRYLAWALNRPSAQRHFEASARGTNLRMIPRAALDDLELDLPDLQTQRAIVALDDLAEQERRLCVRAADLRLQAVGLQLAQIARMTSVLSSVKEATA